MGTARAPKPAKYFVAMLSSEADLLTAVRADLARVLGDSDAISEIVPWAASNFYQAEMGPRLLRGFVSFSMLRSPEDLAAIKLETQRLEDFHRGPAGGRRVNLDPGYLDAYKVVLASTKNAGQRIFLRAGIYAEATLLYHDGSFHGLEYTYRDYLWPQTLAFFAKLRTGYLAQLRARS
jgi:hypothetical protein